VRLTKIEDERGVFRLNLNDYQNTTLRLQYRYTIDTGTNTATEPGTGKHDETGYVPHSTCLGGT
jgi:hypothetical protein